MTAHRVVAGTALAIEVCLATDSGVALSYPDGTPLAAEVWSGGNLAERFAVDVAWVDALAGVLTVQVGSDQTAALDPGRYQGVVFVTDPTYGKFAGYRWAIDLEPVAAATGPVEPPGLAYCSFADVCLGRAWIKEYQSDDEPGGFANQIQNASRWFDEIVVNRGSRRFGRGYLAGLLEAGGLEVSTAVRQAVALKVAADVCDCRNGPGTDAAEHAALAARFRSLAVATATAITARVLVNSGHIRIHLGSSQP